MTTDWEAPHSFMVKNIEIFSAFQKWCLQNNVSVYESIIGHYRIKHYPPKFHSQQSLISKLVLYYMLALIQFHGKVCSEV